MQTYSHFLMTAALSKQYTEQSALPPLQRKALLLGSFMPDMPLLILTLLYFAYRRFIEPLEPGEFIFGARFDHLYFNDPIWISGHNLLHAPLMVLAFATIGHIACRQGRGWGASLFWFAVACGFHSLVDILTHHHDGPLLLFPFDWQTRFSSPVSYWDGLHYGHIFAPLEHLLDLALIAYLLLPWLKRA